MGRPVRGEVRARESPGWGVGGVEEISGRWREEKPRRRGTGGAVAGPPGWAGLQGGREVCVGMIHAEEQTVDSSKQANKRRVGKSRVKQEQW